MGSWKRCSLSQLPCSYSNQQRQCTHTFFSSLLHPCTHTHYTHTQAIHQAFTCMSSTSSSIHMSLVTSAARTQPARHHTHTHTHTHTHKTPSTRHIHPHPHERRLHAIFSYHHTHLHRHSLPSEPLHAASTHTRTQLSIRHTHAYGHPPTSFHHSLITVIQYPRSVFPRASQSTPPPPPTTQAP